MARCADAAPGCPSHGWRCAVRLMGSFWQDNPPAEWLDLRALGLEDKFDQVRRCRRGAGGALVHLGRLLVYVPTAWRGCSRCQRRRALGPTPPLWCPPPALKIVRTPKAERAAAPKVVSALDTKRCMALGIR